MSRPNTLGVIRNLSTKYSEFKRELNNNMKKVNLNDSGSLINDSGKIKLISKRDKNSTELPNLALPPRYVELFDSSNDIFKELLIKFARLQEQQQKRIMPKFNDDENKQIDRQIRQSINEMTEKIKKCEENIKIMALERCKSNLESSVRDNMKQNLLSKLSEFTRKLKVNEEEYMKKYSELVGEDVKYGSVNDSNIQSNSRDNNFLKMETAGNDLIAKRSQEIDNLLKSINELGSIFKDFQTLVLEQGTILDRIDYNLEKAHENIEGAIKELIPVKERMESGCARNTILTLIVMIFIMSILLVFKFTK